LFGYVYRIRWKRDGSAAKVLGLPRGYRVDGSTDDLGRLVWSVDFPRLQIGMLNVGDAFLYIEEYVRGELTQARELGALDG